MRRVDAIASATGLSRFLSTIKATTDELLEDDAVRSVELSLESESTEAIRVCCAAIENAAVWALSSVPQRSKS